MKLSIHTSRILKVFSFKAGVIKQIIISILALIIPLQSFALTFPDYPVFSGAAPVKQNILLLYDNSMSMNKVIGREMDANSEVVGDSSRSTILRNVIRDIYNQYYLEFNWGIETFETTNTNKGPDGNGRAGVYKTYEGRDSTMLFTNDCVGNASTIGGGISPSNGGLRCIVNPEPNGYRYITYERRRTEIYWQYDKGWLWGTVGLNYRDSGCCISLFDHRSTQSTSWNITDDNNMVLNPGVNDLATPFIIPGLNPISLVIADGGGGFSGWMPRMVFLNKGFIFDYSYSGKGKIIEDIKSGTDNVHNSNFLTYLRRQIPDLNSQEIKDSSSETPTIGSFITAKDYFMGNVNGRPSPINNTCQKNHILFATDGIPTVDANGNTYLPTDRADPITGRAYADLYPFINSLHTTPFNGITYDIDTYVVGIGDVGNDAIANQVFNKMAEAGGTSRAYFALDASAIHTAFDDILKKMWPAIPLRQSNGHTALSLQTALQDTKIYTAVFASTSAHIWEGNILKSTPQLSAPQSGSVSYSTGTITGFNTGAAQFLTSDRVNGRGRQIITGIINGSGRGVQGVPFLWDNLGTASQNLLLNSGEDRNIGNQRLNYLRGNRTNEQSANNLTGFRKRDQTVLGDIIDSSPLFVGPSLGVYSDSDFPEGTLSFKNFSQNVMNRTPMIYVGANDGMLHGFNAVSLEEVFAFIPNAVLSKLKSLTDPSYTHAFYVNASPLVADAIIQNRGWTTQLIGFCGNGGTGLFALDITSPDNRRPNVRLTGAENNARNIVLWELNSTIDRDVGYILNQGQINRTQGGTSMQQAQMANGRPAILVGNGYNSPNNSTGLVVVYLDTEGGIPSYKKVMIPEVSGGLSTPTAVDIDFDGITDYAYAGDLQGNVWRFDLRNREDSRWSAFKLFQAIDRTTMKVAPITTAPSVTTHCSQPGLLVIVGTGKYIETEDNQPRYADNHVDFLFGLLDKREVSTVSDMAHSSSHLNAPIPVTDLVSQSYLPGTFVNNNPSPDNIARTLLVTTNNTVNWNAGKKGWILQLYNQVPNPARIVVPPYVFNGVVYFNTISPNGASSCAPANYTVTNQALEACTGQRPQVGVFDINYDGLVDDTDQYNSGDSKVNVSGISIGNQNRVVDSSAWIRPHAFQCTTPPCRTMQTDYAEPIGINKRISLPQRRSWVQL